MRIIRGKLQDAVRTTCGSPCVNKAIQFHLLSLSVNLSDLLLKLPIDLALTI